MTRPLSLDLRERVVASVLAGESCRSMAERFGVAVSSVVKWSQRQRATGSVVPGKMGGHRKPVLDPHRAFIVERITQTPHLTLHGLKAELAARGVKVSHNAVWLFLRREGLRFKKTLFALEQARADVSRRRQRWQSWQAGLDPGRLVFIDETWIKTNMAPLRGWGCQRGTPAWLRTARLLAYPHVPRRAPPRPTHGTLRLRRADQRRMLPRLC
ncbi:transposase [Bradyrhizobium sp. LM6.10]